MTANQLKWMQQNGLDPSQYDMTPDGRVIRIQAAPAEQPKPEVMSAPRAFGTSFLGSLAPSAAGLAAGSKAGAMLGTTFGLPGTIIGGIAGGLGGGFLAGKAQEKLLEEFAPSALQELSRAETQQPIASYLGGFAPNALALRPSVQGMSGLLRPTVRGTATLGEALAKPEFVAPAANIAANVAGSTANQLVNLSQGGEFSAPRFAADVALGTLFSKPTGIGRRLGLHDMPEPSRTPAPELAPAREQAEFMAYPPSEFVTPRDERLGVGPDLEAKEQFFTPEGKAQTETQVAKDYRNWWKSETEPTTDLIKSAAESVKVKLPRERLAQLAQDPEVGEVLRDPTKLPEFVAKQAEYTLQQAYDDAVRLRETSERFLTAEDADIQRRIMERYGRAKEQEASPEFLAQAMGAGRERAGAFTPEGGVRVAPEGWTPSEKKVVRPAATSKEVLGSVRKLRAAPAEEGISLEEALKPSAEDIAKAERIQQENIDTAKLEEGMAAQELLNEAKQSKDQKAIDAALEIYNDAATRLQRAPEAEQRITQDDINRANEIANRRGLKIELERTFSGGEEVRGMYVVDADGNRIVRVNPLMATPDTAIHEIGHDIFRGVTHPEMRRSLMETAADSQAFRDEMMARQAEVDAGKISPEEARNIALEEGLVQAFGEQMPGINRGELRAWFKAFKASMKQLVTGKMSPEDALAWMHYASTEAVPWKGAVTVKTSGEERLQRAQQDTPEFKNWFGESKVVDEQGKPRVMYHGTGKGDIDSFRSGRAKGEIKGGFFAFEPKLASAFAGNEVFVETDWDPSVYPVYLKAEKIFDIRDPAARADIHSLYQPVNEKLGWSWADLENPYIIKELKAKGYDSYLDFEFGSHKSPTAIAVFEPNQIKSATANRGTFSPESSDIRLQRGISEIERLRRRGGIHSTIADNFDAAFNTRRFKEGEANGMIKEIARLNEAQREQLGRLLGQEFDQKRFINPPAELQAAYNEYRKVIQPHWVNEYNNQGMQIRTAAGLRGRQADPFYAPFHRLSDEAKTILTTQQGSPEYVKLQNDYIKQHTDYHLNQGKPLQDAQNAARADFSEEIAMRSAPYDSSKSGTFAGSRKAMGLPLPESWRSYDLLDNLYNYNRRSATDYAHQLHLEKSPETMAALGSKTMFNDAPIPPQVLATTPNLASDPSIQALNKNFAGAPMRSTDKVSAGLTRLVGATTIGTVSKAVEIPGTMISGLRYLQAGDYTEGLMSFLGKLATFADTQRRSYESGLNRRDGAMAMREVMGMADDASGFMNKAADVLSKATGLNALESAARTISQAWGETIVGLNKRRALGGDKEATAFLDTLSKDWRTRSDADLSAQVGRLLQGSYDLTQLPREFLESGAAPYLTWSKWSAGQLNSFMRFAVDPLMQGNAKPLAAHLLIGLLGGAAVGQIREWLNNREGRDINWKELEAWAQQNQGLGAEGYQQLGAKLMNIMQGVGTFGIAGDIVKMTLNAGSGGARQGIATAPAADAVFSTAERAAAALKALDDGEDFGRVMKALLLDTAKTHVQVARVAQNWIDEDENLAYNDRRRKRLFDELTGQSRPGVFTTSYSNLSERDFEKEVNPARMAERAQELVKRAAEKSGDIETYKRELQKLKTQQNTIIPSLERQPQRAARYLSWLEGAEEGRGADAYKRSLIREQEIKYRKALVEGFSGIR